MVRIQWQPISETPGNLPPKSAGASFDRIKATLGNPDLVETQGNFVAAQWCRYKYRITLGFTNGGCSGVISEQSWQ